MITDIPRLPGLEARGSDARQWNWQLEGLCRALSPEVFFHPEGERGTARRTRAATAKTVCQACPVLPQCRRHALEAREPYGIWGGLTEEERAHLHGGGRQRVPA